MIKRLAALLLLGTLFISLSGCASIWGTPNDCPSADWVAEKKDTFESEGGYHAMTHLEIWLRDFREMHRFWDRHFMNYDWGDPYID